MAKLKVQRGNGNEETFPPTAEEIARLHHEATKVNPDFADWLLFGRTVGTRPGETDALRFADFNADCTRVTILRQFNAKTKRIETPKRKRNYPIMVPAPRPRWCAHAGRATATTATSSATPAAITGARSHAATTGARRWTPPGSGVGSARSGPRTSPPTSPPATTAGTTSSTSCLLSSEAVAIQLRHDDHGDLVRKLYGKRDRMMAIEEIAQRIAEHVAI
jgi:hypothetical protein